MPTGNCGESAHVQEYQHLSGDVHRAARQSRPSTTPTSSFRIDSRLPPPSIVIEGLRLHLLQVTKLRAALRRKPVDARRASIADAAIDVLGTDGSRGLTHHAVDDRAGLARGSTSYYCRTRQQLIALAAARLVEIEFAEVAALPAGQPSPADDAVDALSALLVSWLGPSGIVHSKARLELFLLAARDDELSSTMKAFRAKFVVQATARLGGDSPEQLGELIVALFDGLVLAQCSFERTPMTRDHANNLLAPLRTMLRLHRPPRSSTN